MLLWTLGFIRCLELLFLFFPRYIPRSGTAGLCGSSIFSFLRKLHTTSTVAAPNCASPAMWKEGSLFSAPSPAFVICRFFNDGHADQCKVWYLTVVLVWVSLVISHAEHFFMCLWPSVCLLWRNVSLGHFLIGWFTFCCCWVVGAVCLFWTVLLFVYGFLYYSKACEFDEGP